MSEMHILPTSLFERWKQVPAGTSAGMIHLNRFVRESIEVCIAKLEEGISVRNSISEIVSSGEIEEFTTPNFERIFKGIMGFNGEETNISEEVLESKKDELLAHLKQIISLHQNELVTLI
jgi:hypothetical protein